MLNIVGVNDSVLFCVNVCSIQILFESKKKRSSETTEGEGASEQAADGESTSKGTKEGGAAVDCVSSNGNDGESETIEEQGTVLSLVFPLQANQQLFSYIEYSIA